MGNNQEPSNKNEAEDREIFNSNLMKELCLRLYEYLKNDVICQLNKMRNQQSRVRGKNRQQFDDFNQK
ncbi:unnamed protein product [Paramecium octaurelia]|uniref:Uncharacterized protein n=1 Tax=Paramecium octaurelia TaxID=43137 RepID=A0A8S1UWH3_PAROT|nr:unnamed protein product [Paramecium octaurelia]